MYKPLPKYIMHRTIVGIRNSNGITVPKFSECLLDFFTKDTSTAVSFSLENGILVLNESKNGHELRHSPQCPIKLSLDLSEAEKQTDEEIKSDNIGVATSMVIESSDSHILLTKRPSHMRSSPNVWVVPGGHLEFGESVFEAGSREIKEETGLVIHTREASILGLWENVYPLILGAGPPKSHVLVVYLHTKLNESHYDLTKKIIPDPEEVGSFCWLNLSVLNTMLSPEKNIKCDGKQYIYEKGELIEKYIDYCSIFNRWLRIQSEPYSGVNYALRKWMEMKKSEKPFSKF